MLLTPSLSVYAQNATRGDDGEYIFTEDDFLILWQEYLRLQRVETIYEDYVERERRMALKIIEDNDKALKIVENQEDELIRLNKKVNNRYSVLEVTLITIGGVAAGVLIGIIVE